MFDTRGGTTYELSISATDYITFIQSCLISMWMSYSNQVIHALSSQLPKTHATFELINVQ